MCLPAGLCSTGRDDLDTVVHSFHWPLVQVFEGPAAEVAPVVLPGITNTHSHRLETLEHTHRVL